MKVNISISTNAEEKEGKIEEGVSPQSFSFNLGGFDKKLDLKELTSLLIEWLKDKLKSKK